MLQFSTYSVISPEGCASILWKSADKKELAAEALNLTAERLLHLGLVDEVLPEPLGGAHRDRHHGRHCASAACATCAAAGADRQDAARAAPDAHRFFRGIQRDTLRGVAAGCAAGARAAPTAPERFKPSWLGGATARPGRSVARSALVRRLLRRTRFDAYCSGRWLRCARATIRAAGAACRSRLQPGFAAWAHAAWLRRGAGRACEVIEVRIDLAAASRSRRWRASARYRRSRSARRDER